MSDVQKQRLKMNIARMKDMHKQRMQSMKDRLESMPDTKKEEKDLLGKYMPEAKRMNKKELERDTEQERDEKVERMRQQQSKIYEISKYKLAQYQIKAAPDLATRSMDQGSGIEGMRSAANRKKIINRVVGIGRAANKLTQKVSEDAALKKVAAELEGASKKHLKQAQKVKAHVDKMEEENIEEKAMGLYYNINKKRKEGRPMRKKGAKGAPKVSDFARAKQTASEENTETIEQTYARKVARELLDMTESGHVTKHKAKLAKGSDFGDSDEEDFKHAKGMSDDQMHKFAKRYAGVGNYKGKPSRALRRAIKKNPDVPFRTDHLRDHVEIMEDGHQDVASARRKAVLIMEDAAQLLMKLKNMDPMDSLPSWWMNKMSVTAAYMDSMRNYLLVPSEMPSDNMPTESYSMVSSDTNPGMKRRKAPIMVATTPVSEKKEKKKKPKLTPTGPFVSFGTGSYTDSGNGGMGEEVDKEKMKNLDNVMKMYKDRKPLKDLVGQQGPGMKRVKAKMDAIPSTDKAGRVSRSRMQKKFGRNINFD